MYQCRDILQQLVWDTLHKYWEVNIYGLSSIGKYERSFKSSQVLA